MAKRAGPAASGEILTLSFAWPRDLAAEVELKRVSIRDDGRSNPQHVVEARYRLRTESQAGGLRIVSEGLRITRIDGRPEGTPAVTGLGDAEATAALLAPTLRVDAEGRVLEVEGLDELRRRMAAGIAAASPQAAPRAEQIARIALSPERLSEHWASAVESWVGMELELGATYAMEVNEARPGTLEVSERMACFPGGAINRCVQLRLESWLDGEMGTAQLQSQARDLLGQLGAPDLPVEALRSLELRESVELLTEPERLIPHFVRSRRRCTSRSKPGVSGALCRRSTRRSIAIATELMAPLRSDPYGNSRRSAPRRRFPNWRSDQSVARWISASASPCPDQCERTTSGCTWFSEARERRGVTTSTSSSAPSGPKSHTGSRSSGEST